MTPALPPPEPAHAYPRPGPVREMHLAVELPGPTMPSPAMGGPLPDFEAYAHLARTAERGLFDFVLLRDEPEPAGDGRSRSALCHPEPFTVLHALAAVTERIGLAAAVSTAERDLAALACRVAALDRLSAGRAAGPAPAVAALAATGFAASPGPGGRPVALMAPGRGGTTAPGRTAPRASASEETSPEGASSGGWAPEGTVPDEAVPQEAVPGDVVPGEAEPGAPEVIVFTGPAPRAHPGAKLLARIDLTPAAWPAAGPAEPHLLGARLAARVRSGDVDGYVLVPDPAPGGHGLDAFVDRVVPLLQAQGALRTAYRGSTLRDHLGLLGLLVSVPPTTVRKASIP